jgi:hypothetical protein
LFFFCFSFVFLLFFFCFAFVLLLFCFCFAFVLLLFCFCFAFVLLSVAIYFPFFDFRLRLIWSATPVFCCSTGQCPDSDAYIAIECQPEIAGGTEHSQTGGCL